MKPAVYCGARPAASFAQTVAALQSPFDQCKGVAVRKSIPAAPKPEPPNCPAGVRVCGDLRFEPNGFQWCDSKSMKPGPAEQAPSVVKAAAAAL
jgi:hypothetical protein